ncbi:MAG: hypothetical protein ACXWWC_10185 [Chitinophagaceae bacterium]
MNSIPVSLFMNNQPGYGFTGNPSKNISLHLLLNDILFKLPDTIKGNNIVVKNAVSAELKMLGGQSGVVAVINEILTTVLSNARNTCILVTAEKYSDIVTLNFEDGNNFNGYALSFSLMLIAQHARFEGGDISIRGAQKRVAIVSFSFPDMPVASRYIF